MSIDSNILPYLQLKPQLDTPVARVGAEAFWA